VAVDGTAIDLMQDDRFVDLPLVVGERANERTKDYLALIEAAGPIRSRIRAGTLVSGRRWTLKMDNGLDVRLPEIGAAEALARSRSSIASRRSSRRTCSPSTCACPTGSSCASPRRRPRPARMR
jgi:hypothetical protein